VFAMAPLKTAIPDDSDPGSGSGPGRWKPSRASGRFSPPKAGNYFGLGTAGILLRAAIAGWGVYRHFLLFVPEKHVSVLINKEGLDLENSDQVAPDENHRGVQRAVLTEGRYFRNPFYWDWKIVPQVVIPEGMMGIRVSLAGEDLPYGEFLAKVDTDGKATTKG